MKLDTEFVRLPLQFDAARLREEISQFAEGDWHPHPQGFPGNWALPLIAAGGDPADEGVRGPMKPTPFLERCPYIRQVLASYRCALGRSRLMRLDNKAETTAHVDTNYYWLGRVRVHVPVVTYPEVRFHCGERAVHMAAGECWLFDTWRMHNVLNPTPHLRVHLVCDTVGSADFWELARRGQRPFGAAPAEPFRPESVAFRQGEEPALEYEQTNFPVVMSPPEQRRLADWLLGEIESTGQNAGRARQLRALVTRFMDAWQDQWARHGEREAGWPKYRALIDRLGEDLSPYRELSLPNGINAEEILLQALVRPALNPELAGAAAATPRAAARRRPARAEAAPAAAPDADQPRIERPVIIVSAPRSGSSLLFETLARSPDLRTIGGESHRVIEGFPRLQPAAHGWASNRLTEAEATPRVRELLPRAFLEQLRDARGRPPRGVVRLLEKTPKNALRIPFLKAVFPDARFIYLYREPRGALSSIIEAWRSGRFVTYPQLPGWKGPKWSLLLIPGWPELDPANSGQIALRQWVAANETILDDLAQLPREDWTAADYDAFLKNPQAEYERLCAFAGVGAGAALGGRLPLSQHTLTPPDPDKWKKNAALVEPLLAETVRVAERVRPLLPEVAEAAAAPAGASAPADAASKSAPAPAGVAAPSAARPAAPPPDPAAPLKSVYTTNLLELFQRNAFSLLVTTYQAGKLVAIRARDGTLNTHFRVLPKPMGLDVAKRRLALGTQMSVQFMRDVPALAPKVDPPGTHDACFVPSGAHVTGDIDIHEMVYDRDGALWIVNTRFCCLCTLDADHSFTPRWRPPFLTGLAPEDRCHLNGIGLRDGKARYVTMLAETDKPAGWREHKASGGVLMDITDNRVVARGLSMPHSPRWYRDRLWVLESGKGSLAQVDERTGRVETVAVLPGFTRGLDFVGPFAFVGLSQVRETAVFSGIPITEKMNERNCGVWVVNIETGRPVGFVRFEGAVQEIFAVKALAGVRCPEILEPHDKLAQNCYILPDEALKAVPSERLAAGA